MLGNTATDNSESLYCSLQKLFCNIKDAHVNQLNEDDGATINPSERTASEHPNKKIKKSFVLH